MKRLFNLFLAVVMIFSFTCIQVYAANGTGGSGNIDGGGGSMGDATSHGSWNPGNEGVRVTVVRASDHAVVTTPFDLTNKTPSAGIYHFGKVSKIQYNNGTGLSPVQGGYSYKNPVQPMPRIISTNGRNNIEAIKKYFCSEYVVKFIAEETGMDYDTLISGEYKILLEPIAYYKFQGVMIATTATEAALYDEVVGGQLRYWMGSLTAKNLPLSMFLETPDLGYAELRYPTLLSARDERHVQTVLAYRNEVREWSIERLMEAEKNFFAKCGRLPEPYEYTAENGLPMYFVFCRLAKEAFEEIIRAQFLETQELSGPVLTM